MSQASGKYRYLLTNTLIFTISGLLSKFISFLMVPLYTGVLTTAEYGIADMIHTTVTLLLPFLTLSIIEAAIRFCLGRESNKEEIFSSTVFVLLFSILLLSVIEPIVGAISQTMRDYYSYFWLIFTTTIIAQMFFKFVKGLEKIQICAVNSVVIVVSLVMSNLFFLLVLKTGLKGYLSSLVVAEAASALYLFIAARLWRYFRISSINKRLIVEMLRYSIPFIPNAVAWWVNTASDRYIIIALCGVAANGLYSVGNKIPAMLAIVTSIFQQAWQISGVKEYDGDEYSRFYSTVYQSYVSIITIGCSVIMTMTPFMATVLFQKDFFVAWKFTPFLIIGAMFSGISGVLSAIFFATKKNGLLLISTFVGAVVNIVLNILFIKAVGPIGAAVSTAVSFALVWWVRYMTAQRICPFHSELIKDILMFALLFLQAIILIQEIPGSLWISLAISFIVVVINRTVLNVFVSRLANKLRSRGKGARKT